ncbi:MAG: hypothetical protein AAFR61_29865 [Bacteroidota bacterium]
MKHILTTQGKQGVLEILGNPQESILYLNDRPIQYSWYAEVGSTWRYHIAQGLTKQAVDLNQGIEALLKRGIQHKGDFLAVAEYFQGFLAAGTYEYGYYELPRDAQWVEIPEGEQYQSFDYYGGGLDIAPTQNAIDDELVTQYQQAILNGARPAMVLLHVADSFMFFILDGHHKFCAYGLAKIPPHAVIITKQEQAYKSLEETLTLAKEMDCTKGEYLGWMRKEKQNLRYYKGQRLDLGEAFRLLA